MTTRSFQRARASSHMHDSIARARRAAIAQKSAPEEPQVGSRTDADAADDADASTRRRSSQTCISIRARITLRSTGTIRVVMLVRSSRWSPNHRLDKSHPLSAPAARLRMSSPGAPAPRASAASSRQDSGRGSVVLAS